MQRGESGKALGTLEPNNGAVWVFNQAEWVSLVRLGGENAGFSFKLPLLNRIEASVLPNFLFGGIGCNGWRISGHGNRFVIGGESSLLESQLKTLQCGKALSSKARVADVAGREMGLEAPA